MLDTAQLCGGETWTILKNTPKIDLERGDKFRLVKTAAGADLQIGTRIRKRPDTLWPKNAIKLSKKTVKGKELFYGEVTLEHKLHGVYISLDSADPETIEFKVDYPLSSAEEVSKMKERGLDPSKGATLQHGGIAHGEN